MAFIQVFESPVFDTKDRTSEKSGSGPKRAASASRPPVQFINVKSLDDVGTAKFNHLVRSHVMKLNRNAGRRQAAGPVQGQTQSLPINKAVARKTVNRDSFYHQYTLRRGLDSLGDLKAALPPDAPELFQYFETHVAPLQIPFRVNDGKEHPYVKEFMAAALGSEVLLNALFYATLTKSDNAAEFSDQSKRSLQHRAKLTKLLLDGFAKPEQGTSDEAIAAVTLLATFDLVQNGDIQANDMHMTGICDMIARRGGLDALGMNGVLKTSVLWADQCRGTFMRRRPFYCVPPRPEDFPGVPSEKMGYHGTRKMWRQGLIDMDLVETCEELNGLLCIFERNAAGDDTGAPLEFLLDKRHELEARLRSPWQPQDETKPLELMTSVCMRLYMAAVLARMPFGLEEAENVVIPILAQQLKESISSSLLEQHSPVRQWLLEQARPIVARLGSGGVVLEGFKILLMGYLWSETYCDVQARLFWQEALSLVSPS